MPKTLAGAKIILQMDLFNAFKDAYMTQFESNVVTAASKYDSGRKSSLEKKAIDFADSLSKSMAEAIYAFVKEIGIQASMTGTVIAPSGPCTGNIPMPNFTVT